MYVAEVYAYKVHAYEMHPYKIYVSEVHACEVNASESVRCTSARSSLTVNVYEGIFWERSLYPVVAEAAIGLRAN